jgi:hypothetical protein
LQILVADVFHPNLGHVPQDAFDQDLLGDSRVSGPDPAALTKVIGGGLRLVGW